VTFTADAAHRGDTVIDGIFVVGFPAVWGTDRNRLATRLESAGCVVL
jgi:hypothetical protein